MLSTRDLADALGVSESSLKRWVDSGKIVASRTEGGHRRIALADAMRFIRDTRAPLARPELLDLPELAHGREERLISHLVAGDGVAARGWLLGRYLEGATIAELSDGPIREAMHALGELWHHDANGVFVEHRGTDVCLQAVAQLRGMAASRTGAAVALGGAPSGDPYLLATQLASMVVTEAGMRAVNLGPDTPVSAFAHAITEFRPRLVWLSITSPLAPARSRALVRWLAELPPTMTIVIGGQEARTLAKAPAHVRRGHSMAELSEIAASLASTARTSAR